MRITILLLLLSLLSLDIQAQFRAEDEVERIDLKLEKFRRQHQTGTFMVLAGVILSALPVLEGGYNTEAYAFLIGGGVLSLSGMIVSIDSYKHLKKQSKFEKQMYYPSQKDNKEQNVPKPKNYWKSGKKIY